MQLRYVATPVACKWGGGGEGVEEGLESTAGLRNSFCADVISGLIVKGSVRYIANNFGLMYSRKRISQKSFPNFIHIISKSFVIFCQELQDPKRNYENQIRT